MNINKPKPTLNTKTASPRKFIWIVAGVFIIGGLAKIVIPAIKNGGDFSLKPLKAHNDLFTSALQSQLQHPAVFKSKIQPVHSNYNLSGGFHLSVNERYLKQDQPLGKLLRLKDQPPGVPADVVATYVDNGSYMKMTETAYKINNISTINLRYQGVVKTLVQNDSLACYYLKFKGFSLSYDDGLTNDIWASSADADVATISLAFIKRKKTVYIVFLFRPDDKTHDFVEDKLLEMIKR